MLSGTQKTQLSVAMISIIITITLLLSLSDQRMLLRGTLAFSARSQRAANSTVDWWLVAASWR